MRESPLHDLSIERARRLQTFAAVVGAAVIGLGLFVLVGWTIDGPPVLKGALLTDVTMKANTALCFVLVGVALVVTALRPAAPLWRYVGLAAAALAGITGLLTLSEHVVGWDLHIDQLLFREAPNEPATASPGRMGPPASTSFTLLGTAIILVQFRGRPARVAQYLASLTILIAVPGVLGHLYGAELLYAFARVSGIALPTGIALVSLGLGVLATRPDTGLTRLFVAEDPGGAVLRRLILPSTVFFILLGWAASAAQTLEWVDGRFAAAVEVAVLIVFLVVLGIDNAKAMNAVARSRDSAERERERLLESERAARTEAERAARTKDDFLATVSHELRTPLSGILGWTHVLQRTDDPETRRQALEAIERGARAQAKLIEDLLDVSSVVSGKVRLDVRTLDVSEQVEAAIATLSPAAEAKSIQIHRVVSPNAGPVKGDASRLQQVFWNVLANAIKFTPKGGTVQVHVERIESALQVTISDNGSGIAPEFLPHVFDRFRQQDSSPARAHSGLGLGLSIVKHIVDLHGGTVQAHSAGIGYGSTFIVRLPVVIARTAAVGSDTPGDLTAPRHLRGVKVLLVDDDADSVASVQRLLLEYDAEVAVAHGASQALELMQTWQPNVIVADIGMPDMDGYEFVRHLRAGGKRTPVIALTAFSRPADRIKALEVGFNFHLTKPVEPRELVAVVGSLAGDVTSAPAGAPQS